MEEPPDDVAGASVLLYSVIDDRHRPTGGTQHIVDGVLQPACQGLLIIRAEPPDEGFFLFGCDADWSTVTDTWHASLEETKAQAEFEYEGVSRTWLPPPL